MSKPASNFYHPRSAPTLEKVSEMFQVSTSSEVSANQFLSGSSAEVGGFAAKLRQD
jgi:hypothetical protein